MLFFENTKGFHFKSLQSLYRQTPTFKYEFNPKNVTLKSQDNFFHTETFNILKLEVMDNFNTLEATTGGVFHNRLITIDPLTRKSYVKDFNYDNYFNESRKLNNNQVTVNNNNTVYKDRFGKSLYDSPPKDKETGKYKIYDIKTSSNGWNKYQKEDPAKYSQILLYKAFYSKKFNVDLSQIEVEFFILKRKLYENVDFPQSRIQIFEPMHNKQAVIATINDFGTFVSECFKSDGTYNTDGSYPKIPGKAKKNCKYCSHHKVNCDGKEDKLLN